MGEKLSVLVCTMAAGGWSSSLVCGSICVGGAFGVGVSPVLAM